MNSAALQDGRFLIVESIGRGGMAVVYRAFDRIDQRLVALKVPLHGGPADAGHPLAAEFRRWWRVRHPNVVQVRGLSTSQGGPIAPGLPYLVLEHVAGGRIDRVLRPGAEQPEVIELVAAQLLLALSHVHRAELVHRDVKPANVLVGRSTDGACEIKLTDFGLAVKRGERETFGRVSGSLPFVAPEALLGGPTDERTDLYGLGILLHQLATGELPVRTNRVDRLIRWHLAGPPADPRRVRPGFPERLSRFICGLTERDPTRRPPDCVAAGRLLGLRAPRSDAPRSQPPDRSLRTELRLALDATRLGARIRFVLPTGERAARTLVDQVELWSQVHGVLFDVLDGPDARQPVPLRRLLLRLCLEEQPCRSLPGGVDPRGLGLSMLAGVPLRNRRTPAPNPLGGAHLRQTARRLCRFILERPRHRALALHIRGTARREPLTRCVVTLLLASCATPAPDARRAGVLLVVEPDFSPATRRGSSSPN